jgi:hypothetical protein
MNTQNLSVSVTLYSDGDWSVALVQTTTEVGRRARKEQLVCRKTDLEHVWVEVAGALHKLVESERARVAGEAAERVNTPEPSPRRAQR